MRQKEFDCLTRVCGGCDGRQLEAFGCEAHSLGSGHLEVNDRCGLGVWPRVFLQQRMRRIASADEARKQARTVVVQHVLVAVPESLALG